VFGKKFYGGSLVGLLASTALASSAWAHTTSIGFENAGPGSVTFWYGSYHGGTSFNEGSLQLQGPGTDSTVLFDMLSQTKPLGLIDGTTNFYISVGGAGGVLIDTDPLIANGPSVWQGSTFDGLSAGTYTFTYIPIAFPTVQWDPLGDAILTNMLTLSGAIVGGGNDGGIMATETAVSVTEAQTQDLRQIVRANAGARHTASEGASSMIMSQNGPSTTDVSVWARIGGGYVSAEFGDDLDISHFLGQVGVEVGVAPKISAGVSIGGALSSAETADEDLDGDAFFVQPYVAFVDDGLTVIASVSYTYTDYDDSTDIIDSSDRYSGSLSVAYDVPLDEDTTATPFGYLAGGIEKLDAAGDEDDIEFFIGRVGVELSRTVDLLNTGTMHVFASVAGEYVSTNEPELSAASLLVDYDDSRLGAHVKLGLDFTIAGTNTQFFASINGSGLFTDAPGSSGRFGLKIPF